MKTVQHGEKQIVLNDLPYEFKDRGITCSVDVPKVFGKGSKAWSMRTLTCAKADVEASASASCGGTHGKDGSAGFSLKVGNDSKINPSLMCQE